MKTFKIISNLLLLIAALFLGYSYVKKKGMFSEMHAPIRSPDRTLIDDMPEGEEVIRTFFENLTNQDGKTISSKDFMGKHMLVMFGFTSCRHICPAELSMASQLLHQLGDDANKLQVVFITVDPTTDTVQRLKAYHSAFDSRIQMLTGDEENIREVLRNYRVYAEKGAPGSSEEIDHSAHMYLINEDGRYVEHFTPQDYGSISGLLDMVNRHFKS
ncbi:SCO family protein [Anaplasma platys]|uniref:SCO family protein n=1 Tax=Anaplasma platys TaxID=949 RepID=A0A858PZ34_9RICK|nr:SCO family protein [Anaplasma platys]QJC27808.1 SCO family protein [Anaplasma platys]